MASQRCLIVTAGTLAVKTAFADILEAATTAADCMGVTPELLSALEFFERGWKPPPGRQPALYQTNSDEKVLVLQQQMTLDLLPRALDCARQAHPVLLVTCKWGKHRSQFVAHLIAAACRRREQDKIDLLHCFFVHSLWLWEINSPGAATKPGCSTLTWPQTSFHI